MLKKISYTVECQGKNYISTDLGKKNSYPNHPFPPPPPLFSIVNGRPLKIK